MQSCFTCHPPLKKKELNTWGGSKNNTLYIIIYIAATTAATAATVATIATFATAATSATTVMSKFPQSLPKELATKLVNRLRSVTSLYEVEANTFNCIFFKI